MTNLVLNLGNAKAQAGCAKVKTMKHSRPDSVSLPSRCRVLGKYVATLALFLCLGVGQMWAYSFTSGKIVYFDNNFSKNFCPNASKSQKIDYNIYCDIMRMYYFARTVRRESVRR